MVTDQPFTRATQDAAARRDRRLRLAHAGWYLTFTLAHIILVLSLPGYVQRVLDSSQAIDASPAFALITRAAGALVSIATAVLCLALAVILFKRRRDEPMAVFTSFFLIGWGTILAGPLETLAWIDPRAIEFGFRVQTLVAAPMLLPLYLFPNGRFVPRWTRWLALLGLPALPLAFVTTSAEWFDPRSPLAPLVNGLILAVALTGVFAQVYRYRRVSDAVERQQTKWFVFGIMLLVVCVTAVTVPYLALANWPSGVPLPWWAHLNSFGWWLSLLIVPFALAVAIMRYRLWDVDVFINRTLVYGALTAVVVTLYVLTVGALGALFQATGNLGVSLVATGVAAILFQPVRARLQHGVNRLMYGERDNPYAVLSQLADRLKAALAPEAVLPAIVETVAHALKLPYVAVTLNDAAVVAACGRPGGAHESFPLVYQSGTVGQLIVAPRAPNEPFTPAERRLLGDVAQQAGVAAHNVQLTADLQRSRERLITAREEERRRLRRDLHDGLGPTLAGLTLKLDAARNQLGRDPAAADNLLAELKTQTQTAIADIRRLVYDLRPPALDELGLVPALREQAAAVSVGRLSVSVEAPDRLPPLPAAVEVAAYRIVAEALTNVMHHARARTCAVRFSVGAWLEVEIVDDGVGLPADRHTGVGLASMRERAAELGGSCVIEPAPNGGTRVVARLPFHSPG